MYILFKHLKCENILFKEARTMKVQSFQVTKFRNIVDSGEVEINQTVTCLVGKNEAGKSGMLEALYLFNPAYEDNFNVDEQYPRWLVVKDRKSGSLNEHAPIKIKVQLESADIEILTQKLGECILENDSFYIERKYDGKIVWGFAFDEKKILKNIISKFPKTIIPEFVDVYTKKDIFEVLKKLKQDEAENKFYKDQIQQVESELKSIGLDKKDLKNIIIGLLENRLPRFFRFTSYSTLPGRIDFNEIISPKKEGPASSSIQTARALLKLAEADLDQLSNNDYELRKGELEAVQIDLTNQVFEYWKQNPDLEVLIDVDKETTRDYYGSKRAVVKYIDIRLRDKRTGYSNNFTQRSSGFQWFFSFLAAFSEFENHDIPIILLDEPALTLHARAQADFLRFINERLSPIAPVIYTTHSPFMIEPGKLERVRIIEDNGPPKGAISRDEALASDPDSLFPLQAALGYDIAQNLFVGANNLIVEGTSDFIYLTILSTICIAEGKKGIDERWRILPAGGATNIPTFVSLIGPHLDVTVLADSDTKGMQRINNMAKSNLLKATRIVFANQVTNNQNADIEDLFSDGDYLNIYNKTYGSTIKISDLPHGDRIVKRIEKYIKKEYVHGEVAETLLRKYHEITFTETTINNFSNLFDIVNSTISK